MKVAKANYYKTVDGDLTTDKAAGVELVIAQGQEVTAAHLEIGIKGVEHDEAEPKSAVPETENKSEKKK